MTTGCCFGVPPLGREAQLLMFGEKKCKVITIGENHDNNWTLGNIHLEVLESYKYLGETISNDGSMTPHITEKIRDTKAQMQAI